jgi:hypothetical protein
MTKLLLIALGGGVGSVPIVLEKAEMRNKELILMGTCKNCGKKICRVVEPEKE